LLVFSGPLLFYQTTNLFPLYLTGVLRILSIHVFLSLHFVFVDKDNVWEKISQHQIQREKGDYLVGIYLHMYAQLVLQVLFPPMFSSSPAIFGRSCLYTLLTHVLLVEPLYYVVHRWLHVPEQMKKMHGHHHLSVNPVPSTSLVQNFVEHFIYIATFGPAMLLPFFLTGSNHWVVIMAYLILFDLVNAFGHTNVRCRHWVWDHPYSPLRYLFYTPEFHLGHHAYFNNNFALFMPLWDHLFGTYREYKKQDKSLALVAEEGEVVDAATTATTTAAAATATIEETSRRQLTATSQDLVFIGHNGGLGHLLTVPEFCFYNMYDSYRRTFLPIELELVLVSIINACIRQFASCYKVSRYLVDGNLIGRIVCILRTPMDYAAEGSYDAVNRDILEVIRSQNASCGTRYFGLGNLNKMKQLNDGGSKIAAMVREDKELKDKNIRVWTGDTLTAASVFYQICAIPNLKKLFYVGANGKIGTAVCKLLVQKGISICIYSKHAAMQHPNITYTQVISDMEEYDHVLIGKLLRPSVYQKAINCASRSKENGSSKGQPQYLLDYTVPFIPLQGASNVHHVQIGVLKVTNNAFLRGYYDICMGTEQNHIYPCHAGCILNMVSKRETDETGEIDLDSIAPLWAKANEKGLFNREIL